MDTVKNLSKALRDAIERNVAAKKGYAEAADKVNGPTLKAAFRKQAAQRMQFAVELQNATNMLSVDEFSGPGERFVRSFYSSKLAGY